MNIIVLIPVFNDFRSTSKLIEEIDSSISNLNASFSVVVINDASTEVKNLDLIGSNVNFLAWKLKQLMIQIELLF